MLIYSVINPTNSSHFKGWWLSYITWWQLNQDLLPPSSMWPTYVNKTLWVQITFIPTVTITFFSHMTIMHDHLFYIITEFLKRQGDELNWMGHPQGYGSSISWLWPLQKKLMTLATDNGLFFFWLTVLMHVRVQLRGWLGFAFQKRGSVMHCQLEYDMKIDKTSSLAQFWLSFVFLHREVFWHRCLWNSAC